ncbi:MAG: hypothetical protein KAW12_13425 [Candidatus Aminicenantes bacterium]|nr:hypothetical protein [Candidatus Aminicenantes bacterium]
MSIDTQQPASGIPEVVFIREQPDRETLTLPDTWDTVFLAGDADFTQESIIAENKEKRNSYAMQEGVLAAYKTGTFSFPTNLKMSGVLSNTPRCAPLLKSVLGRETVNPGVDVQYEHYRRGDPLVYCTILFKKEIETELILGALVNKLSLKINGDILNATWDGFFSRKYRAGTDETAAEINGTSTPVTVIPLTIDAMNFDIGAYIVVGSDDNTGAGFKITGKDEIAKTLTIEGGVSTLQPAGSIVQGWAPVVQVSGVDVVGTIGDFKIDRGSLQPFDILSATLDIDNGFKELETIKSSSLYPKYTGRGKRKVSFNFDDYENIDNINLKEYARRYASLPCEINVGDEPGNILTIALPTFKPASAKSSGSEEKKQSVSGQCYPDTGDDESTFVFK